MFPAIFLVVFLGAEAPPANADPLAAQVRQLVRDLDSPQLNRRDAAEKKLLGLGPRALDQLPETFPSSKADVAERVARVRQSLQRQRAEAAMRPSRVNLRGSLPLEKIFAAVESQTGNAIDASRLGPGLLQRNISVDFHETPFWEAIDRLLGPLGANFYAYGDQQRLQVTAQREPREPLAGRISYAGPFRFEALSVLAQRDLRGGDRSLRDRKSESRKDPAPLTADGSLRLDVEVAWEPRLTPIYLQQRMADVEAIDDRGRILAVESREAVSEIPVQRGPIAKQFTLSLDLPERDVHTIANLRGTLQAFVPGPYESFRFTELATAKDVVRRSAGVTVVLEAASQADRPPDGDSRLGETRPRGPVSPKPESSLRETRPRGGKKTLEVRLLVRFDQPGDALASHRTWIFNNPARLERPGDKPIEPESVIPTRQTANELGIALTFSIDRAAEEYTLVYQTPGMIFSLPLVYRFRDIPLP